MNPPSPELVRFGCEIRGDLARAERREWRLANGLGEYVAGSLDDQPYHGCKR